MTSDQQHSTPAAGRRGKADGASNPERRLYSTVLACEAVVIGLAIPVAISVQKVDGTTAGWAGGALAVLCLLACGVMGRPWGFAVGTALQVVVLLTGFVVPMMFILGVLFGALWGTAFWLGRQAEQARAR
ncbi:DUF4233 domain-containing protein [Actinomadura rupiterrae]|uniref:DUF4233 domain-containing protein n=1 Tax=Actinomadura rupiterrae TaxID=559627 RepID=UPI0020A44A86|nr:DUF4233 domain-containing protein [Actinomadura rupiterrae]MCP2343782.1 hypothetical protein [Actinomadura rupiterrae]